MVKESKQDSEVSRRPRVAYAASCPAEGTGAAERKHSGEGEWKPACATKSGDLELNFFTKDFYARPTVTVARDLLGTVLCRRFADGRIVSAPIVEVEAYTEDDPACHAFRGITERCRVLFGPPGLAYVYFIYGMYNCLNVVTEPDGVPGAVLIRALATEGGTGPGKLCHTWQIDRSFNGADFTSRESTLWIVEGQRVPDANVGETVRIGVTSAQDRIWRFYMKNNEFVSGPRKLGGGKRPILKKKLTGRDK